MAGFAISYYSEMEDEAQSLSISLTPGQLADLQQRTGGNPMLARRTVREEYLGLDGNAPDHTQWIDGTPLLIAGLMCFMILRFLGLGFNNTSLYLLGGMITVAVGVIRIMIYSLPRQSGRLAAMISVTHAAFSISLTSIVLGTSSPEILGISAIASLLPDIDTSKSLIGRLFLPISRWIETRTVHRGIIHSFFATGVITLITYPLAPLGYAYLWKALILGYFWGWFADVFTKSGVEAFYPSRGKVNYSQKSSSTLRNSQSS